MDSVNGGCLTVEKLIIGGLDNNVYFIGDGKSLIVVDPTSNPDAILDGLGDRKLDAIFLTHHHFDHIGAACSLRQRTGAIVIASAIDAPLIEEADSIGLDPRKTEPCTVDQKVADGDIIQIGDMAWKVLLTPGHTAGGICFYINPSFGCNPEGAPLLVAGDTLFKGTIGRTDFKDGSMQDMKKSLVKLAHLPDDTIVLPGHYDHTTIGAERKRVFAHYA